MEGFTWLGISVSCVFVFFMLCFIFRISANGVYMNEWDPHSCRCACDRDLNDGKRERIAKELPSEFVGGIIQNGTCLCALFMLFPFGLV